MKVTILGLTITSSWGNGHATTFRSLCRALHANGHVIEFLEKDVEWYASHRDLPHPAFCHVSLYEDWDKEGRSLALALARDADIVVIGSYFPDAIAATQFLLDRVAAPLAFYDIDTPITMAGLRASGKTPYLDASLIPSYAAYMSFTGGPLLREIEQVFGSPLAVPLYCSVDAAAYKPVVVQPDFACDLSYLGTYAPDRQAKLMELLDRPALTLPQEKFLVAGPMYPEDILWAPNVRRISHVAPPDHPAFYSSARFSLNLTRGDMVQAGYSPSVRLFEAGACAATILSDSWAGLETFLTPGDEILIVASHEEVVDIVSHLEEQERRQIGRRAQERILSSHTSTHRALEFEAIVERICASKSSAVSAD